jgi:hypothetical protein
MRANHDQLSIGRLCGSHFQNFNIIVSRYMPHRGLSPACWVILTQWACNFGMIVIVKQNYVRGNIGICPLQSANKDNQHQEFFNGKVAKGSLPLEEGYHY